MVTIGYMEGTDSGLLTKLAASGAETLPLGNGWDGHGQYIAHLNVGDGVSAVVGYYHKFVPLSGSNLTPADLLKSCNICGIKIFIIADKDDHGRVKKTLGEVASDVQLMDTSEVRNALLKLL
jgi:hypothetical protein